MLSARPHNANPALGDHNSVPLRSSCSVGETAGTSRVAELIGGNTQSGTLAWKHGPTRRLVTPRRHPACSAIVQDGQSHSPSGTPSSGDGKQLMASEIIVARGQQAVTEQNGVAFRLVATGALGAHDVIECRWRRDRLV